MSALQMQKKLLPNKPTIDSINKIRLVDNNIEGD
jgi:hypothetical protein